MSDNHYIGSRIEEQLNGQEPTGGIQSRIEWMLSQLMKNSTVKVLNDVTTVADLPVDGNGVGNMRFVMAEGLFYIWKETDGVGEWVPVGADFDPSDFARVDGAYPDMTVGKSEYADVSEYSAYAEQLDSNQKLTVSSPFTFRPAGGGADVEGYLGSKAEIRSVFGKTLVWNQSSNDTTTHTLSNPGIRTAYIWFPNGEKLISGHKYYISADEEFFGFDSTAFNQTMSLYTRVLVDDTYVNEIVTRLNFSEKSKIFACAYDAVSDGTEAINPGSFWIYINATNLPEGGSCTTKNVMLIDLTRMFGVGNEPSTVEEFRSFFPLPYYAYDAGSLLNFAGTSIKTVGFNQWDEEWESGSIDSTTGIKIPAPGTFRSKNYIKVIPGNTYCMSTATDIPVDSAIAIVYGYAEDKSFVGELSRPSKSNGGVFTIPDNCAFLLFRMGNAYISVHGAIYGNDICINLSWSGYRNGEYEPYWSETKALPVSTYFPDGMKSAGTVRDELTKDKAIKRIYGVDIGTINWHIGDIDEEHPFGFFYSNSLSQRKYGRDNILTARYMNGSTFRIDKHIFGNSSGREIYIVDSSIETIEDLVSSLSGVILYYESNEPVETPINPPLDLSFRSADYGTELLLPDNDSEPVTAPLYANIDYVQNLRDKLQRLPMSPSVEGDYIIHYNGINQKYKPIPTAPTADGEYILKCIVASGVPTFIWTTV